MSNWLKARPDSLLLLLVFCFTFSGIYFKHIGGKNHGDENRFNKTYELYRNEGWMDNRGIDF